MITRVLSAVYKTLFSNRKFELRKSISFNELKEEKAFFSIPVIFSPIDRVVKEVECLSVKAEQLKLKFNTIVETDRKYLREAYEKQILGMSKCLRKRDFFWAFIGFCLSQ